MPGTLVGIARNGPPNRVFGLGSQLSSWLIPPSIQMKRTCLAFFCMSAAAAGCSRLERPSDAPTPAAAPRSWRRERECSQGLQRGFMLVVHAKLVRRQQGPEQVADRGLAIGGVFRKIVGSVL